MIKKKPLKPKPCQLMQLKSTQPNPSETKQKETKPAACIGYVLITPVLQTEISSLG